LQKSGPLSQEVPVVRPSRWVFAVVTTLVVSLLAGACVRDTTHGRAGTTDHDVIVHLFQWPWDSVAQECAEVLGPAGFAAVQVSPPHEHVVLAAQGFPWWQDYQPVSYQLVTRRGDRDAFAGMVATCRAAGVDIYVDAILNHMTGGASAGSGPGSAGSPYSHYDYPAVPYGFDDFHHCGRHGDNVIRDWTDPWEVQNCMLLSLADLKTGSPLVQNTLVDYLNDLISLGVAGFRVDAAKHVPADNLAAIYARLDGEPYLFQEVIEGSPVELSPTGYTGIGAVTEFRYGDMVSEAFRRGRLARLSALVDSMLLDSADAVVFIDNHDTQRGMRSPLTYRDDTSYAMAQAFMLAFPYGRPKVMSSFDFRPGDHDASPPSHPDGTTKPVDCADPGWVCEHRWRTTANLVQLRNVSHGHDVVHWWSDGNQLAFGRGSAAFLVFNRDEAPLTRTFTTDLPAGTYCEVARGDVTGGECTGETFSVDADGRLDATVPGNGMVALHIDARTDRD
jgi:alpha-amylase